MLLLLLTNYLFYFAMFVDLVLFAINIIIITIIIIKNMNKYIIIIVNVRIIQYKIPAQGLQLNIYFLNCCFVNSYNKFSLTLFYQHIA